MTFELLLKIIMGIGIPSIVIGCICIGCKLQILDTLEETTKKVKHNIKLVADCLIESSVEFNHTRLEEYSPFKITEKGEKWLREVGFIEIFNENSQDFFEFIDSEKPTTKYDIENSAIKSFLILFEKEYFDPIKKYLYTHPQESLSSMSKVAGVYIRDKYFESHPEITS